MKTAIRTGTALLAAALTAGCSTGDRRNDHTISTTRTDAPIAGRPSLGMALPIPGTDACIVPFAVEDRKALFRDDDPFTRGGLASYAATLRQTYIPGLGGTVRWHNAIVRAFASDEGRMVLDRRGIISRYSMYGQAQENRDAPFRAHWIVFVATTEDTNADGRLDDRDGTVAIISSADGRTMRTLTPSGGQVWEVARGDAGGRFYFKVVADTNRDGQFDAADAATIYQWLPSSDAPAATPVVSPEELGRLESLVG